MLEVLGWAVLFGLWAMGVWAICKILWGVYQTELRFVTTMGKKPTPFPQFAMGDLVVLKDKNPYKGTLKAGTPYEVVGASPVTVVLRAGNGTQGYFPAEYFELYTGLGRRMPIDLSQEYEDALAAQEAMDGLSTTSQG